VQTIDYNQVAKYEAATELLMDCMAMCRNLAKTNKEFADKLEDKRYELRKTQQTLRAEDANMVKNVIDTYGPIAREYYGSKEEFKINEDFFDIKVSYED